MPDVPQIVTTSSGFHQVRRTPVQVTHLVAGTLIFLSAAEVPHPEALLAPTPVIQSWAAEPPLDHDHREYEGHVAQQLRRAVMVATTSATFTASSGPFFALP